MFKLFITLSDLCNFSCEHCINSSGPKSKRWRFSEVEQVQLIRLVNSDSRIKQIVFSGGEPSLQLGIIKKIQNQIVRPIDYRMTSNGWLGSQFSNVLDEIRLNALTLSYDKFHQPFITIETLLEVVEVCKSRGVSVTVNFVFDSVEELTLATPLVAAGAKLETCRLIRSGRGRQIACSETFVSDSSAIHGSCPSLALDDPEGLEKMVFIPGAGLSPCCGPLAFDELLPKEEIYSPLEANYLENPLRSRFLGSTFFETADANGIDLTRFGFGSRCEACTWLNGQIVGKDGPTINHFLEQPDETAYYTVQNILDRPTESLLAIPFVLSYFMTCTAQRLEQYFQPEAISSGEVKVVPVERQHFDDVFNFMKKNYYHPNRLYYSESEIEALSAQTPSYFNELGGSGLIYFKGDQVVGLVLKNQFDSHPAIQMPTIHVGYWGYDQSLLAKNEVNYIKSDWIKFLTHGSMAGRLIDCSIEWFNDRSLAFATKLGFQIGKVRIDKRKKQ